MYSRNSVLINVKKSFAEDISMTRSSFYTDYSDAKTQRMLSIDSSDNSFITRDSKRVDKCSSRDPPTETNSTSIKDTDSTPCPNSVTTDDNTNQLKPVFQYGPNVFKFEVCHGYTLSYHFESSETNTTPSLSEIEEAYSE